MSPSKYNKLAGKSVLIIGGSSGIGHGIAEASLESGANVIISSSSQGRLDTAVSKLVATHPGASIRGVACDLSRPSAEQDLEALLAKVGPVDHLVFTAADPLSLPPLSEVQAENILKAAHMRLVVPMLVIKVATRHLPRTTEASITLTSGSAAWQATPGWGMMSYMAAGLQGLVRGMAPEIAPLRINAVAPGFVDTGLWDGMTAEAKAALVRGLEERMPVRRAGRVEDVVEAYLWLMKDRNVTGTTADSNSGQFVVCPW